MVLACIACGGIIETTLIFMGLGAIYRWLKNRHNKEKCDCCQEHKKNEQTR